MRTVPFLCITLAACTPFGADVESTSTDTPPTTPPPAVPSAPAPHAGTRPADCSSGQYAFCDDFEGVSAQAPFGLSRLTRDTPNGGSAEVHTESMEGGHVLRVMSAGRSASFAVATHDFAYHGHAAIDVDVLVEQNDRHYVTLVGAQFPFALGNSEWGYALTGLTPHRARGGNLDAPDIAVNAWHHVRVEVTLVEATRSEGVLYLDGTEIDRFRRETSGTLSIVLGPTESDSDIEASTAVRYDNLAVTLE